LIDFFGVVATCSKINKKSDIVVDELPEKTEEIRLYVSGKKLKWLNKFLLGYAIYIAIHCLHKLIAFL
jgi:hypothetical protein